MRVVITPLTQKGDDGVHSCYFLVAKNGGNYSHGHYAAYVGSRLAWIYVCVCVYVCERRKEREREREKVRKREREKKRKRGKDKKEKERERNGMSRL